MIDLTNIFVGFVHNYRSLNLRFGPHFESMSYWTMREIEWFARLGECLGFYAVTERDLFRGQRRVDLAWVDPFTDRVVLHLERENDPAKAQTTIEKKLLPHESLCGAYCIGIFDELPEGRTGDIEDTAVSAFGRNLACVEALMVCYAHLPSTSEAAKRGMPRYRMRWPVSGLFLKRGTEPRWLRAECTTDESNAYTMYLVDPAVPKPYKPRRGSDQD